MLYLNAYSMQVMNEHKCHVMLKCVCVCVHAWMYFKGAISLRYRRSTAFVMSKQILSSFESLLTSPMAVNRDSDTNSLSSHRQPSSRLRMLVTATSGGFRSYFLNKRVLHSPWCWIKNSDSSKAQLQDTRRATSINMQHYHAVSLARSIVAHVLSKQTC